MRARKARPTTVLVNGLPSQIYRLIADTIPHMVWTARIDGWIDYYNQRTFEYCGKSVEELEGFGWKVLVHPQDWPYCKKRWESAVETGKPYESQHRLRRADGEYRWHLAAAQPLKDSAGRIMKWFGTCTDVEEQMRAAQALARRRDAPPSGGSVAGRDRWQGEEWLRSILTLSSDFFWETDAEHRLTVLEPGGQANSFVFTPGRLGKTRWEIPSVLPDAEGWRRHRETLDARQAFRDFEIVRRDDAGVVRHFVVHGGPFFDHTGRFLGYRGVGREITARKLAERALQENNRQFRAFMESLPGIAWIKDSKLRYVWTSASYERILGKSIESMRGRDDFAVWPAAMAEKFRFNDEKVLRVKGALKDVANTALPDGSVVRWMAVKFPLQDETGALGVAGIAFDITGRSGDDAADEHDDSPLARLSGRELQVLHLLVEGCTSAEIGTRLGLSPKSIDTYRSRLMAKLDLEDLPALVKFAIRHGITTNR